MSYYLYTPGWYGPWRCVGAAQRRQGDNAPDR